MVGSAFHCDPQLLSANLGSKTQGAITFEAFVATSCHVGPTPFSTLVKAAHYSDKNGVNFSRGSAALEHKPLATTF
jgi:hypothetical protein